MNVRFCLPCDDLPGQRLHDLRAAEEAMEIQQHQHGRAVGCGQGIHGSDRGQRIGAAGVGLAVLTGNLQALGRCPRWPVATGAHGTAGRFR